MTRNCAAKEKNPQHTPCVLQRVIVKDLQMYDKTWNFVEIE